MAVVLGLVIGVSLFLALLLLPVERLWLVTGPFIVLVGAGGLVFAILVETGVIAGRRVPVPVWVLVCAPCVISIYAGFRKMWTGWSEYRADRKSDFRRPPPGY